MSVFQDMLSIGTLATCVSSLNSHLNILSELQQDGYYKRLHHPVYLLPLCLVCKAWTSPAQRNLYKYLSFHEPYSETKLLKLLSNRALLGKRHQIVRLQWRDTFKDEADLIYATRAMIGLLHYSKDSLKALSMGEYAESETQDLLLALSGLSNIREFSTGLSFPRTRRSNH